MKGIMVPLLMLLMTGIVVGQQTDSNSFRSTAYRPNAQSGTQGLGSFSPQANPSDVKPFDLSVSDEQIQGIRNGGELVSKIDPRDKLNKLLPVGVISGITLVHEKNLTKQLPVKKMIGQDAGNGMIKFALDDWALKDLENSKLSFEFSTLDRGRFNQVAFYYGGFLPLPGPESLPGDVDFVGPVMPARTPQVANNSGLGQWNPNATTPTNPAINHRGLGGNQGQVGNQPNGWTTPQENPRQETLAEMRSRILLERLKQEQAAQAGEPRPTDPATHLLNPPSLTDQQIRERLAFLERQRQIKLQEDNLAAREAELARQKQELANQRFVDSLKVNRIDDITPQFTRQTGPVPGTDYQPSGPVLERPARFASRNADDVTGNAFASGQTPTQRQTNNITPRPTGGVGKFVTSIPGTNKGATDANLETNRDSLTEQKKEKRTEGFIYFMLLCSLGLNVYLGLISRGFYVRYNELADELRETFTATM